MSVKNIINTIKTYNNPAWFYIVCMQWVRSPLAKLSLRNGLVFFVRVKKADLFVVHEVFANKAYDVAIRDLDPKKSTVIDVGAHVGTFSINASSHSKHIYSYEPEKENYELLKMNVKENAISNVTTRHFGISSTTGKFSIFVSSTNSSCNSIFKELSRNVESTQQIKCVTLDDEIKRYDIKHIDLLKLDCEGAEYQILLSLPKNIYLKIDKIIFEYQDIPSKNIHHRTLVGHLKTMGFSSRIVSVMDKKTGTILATKKYEK